MLRGHRKWRSSSHPTACELAFTTNLCGQVGEVLTLLCAGQIDMCSNTMDFPWCPRYLQTSTRTQQKLCHFDGTRKMALRLPNVQSGQHAIMQLLLQRTAAYPSVLFVKHKTQTVHTDSFTSKKNLPALSSSTRMESTGEFFSHPDQHALHLVRNLLVSVLFEASGVAMNFSHADVHFRNKHAHRSGSSETCVTCSTGTSTTLSVYCSCGFSSRPSPQTTTARGTFKTCTKGTSTVLSMYCCCETAPSQKCGHVTKNHHSA